MSGNKGKGLTRIDSQDGITDENIEVIIGKNPAMGRDPKAAELLSGNSSSLNSRSEERTETEKLEKSKPENSFQPKQKTKAQQNRIKKEAERRKKESILFFLPEDEKQKLMELGKKLDVPYSQICSFAVLKYLHGGDVEEELTGYRIPSNIPVSKYMLDLEKRKNQK